MTSSTEPRSPFVRFLDAFLQEENIKWMLCAGVCILLGSSLRLVTTHWDECTPAWKYLILLGYTATVFLLGEFSYHRLGLRKTGTVLMALTVLLTPLGFFALHWVRPHQALSAVELMQNTGLTALVGINLVWSAFAAHRIFRHFLRQSQPTFLACYLILCAAGAIVPGLPVAWASILALALWAVFAAGTIKVNRHVFWLTEEHRLPRIFGFFPILLLGAQFAAVFTFALAGHIALPWLGLLSALVAVPILLTADTVARIFEQRTGGLVRPIPWSIIGPLLLGTILSVAGVVVSLTGWPSSPAVVPTAALAALSLAVVAQRTKQSAFVWGMVFCLIATYQTSPVFFKEIALQVRDQAATAVHETRLPYAFYGLTYAPLIVAFSLFAGVLQRRGNRLFADPLRITASALPWILFGASFTHPSAILPVAIVLCPLFLGQAALFRQRLLLIPAAMAFLAAAYGLPVFCHRVLGQNISADAALFIWTAAAGLLFAPGVLVDRWSRSLEGFSNQPATTEVSQHICQLFSLAATLVAALVWVVGSCLPLPEMALASAPILSVVIGALLGGHAVRWLTTGLGEIVLAFGTYAAVRFWLPAGMTSDSDIQVISFLFLGQWLLTYGLARVPQTRIARAFGSPLINISLFGLTALFGLFVVNWIVVHVGFNSSSWTTGVCLLIWALDASRRFGHPAFSGVIWCVVFVFSSAVITDLWGLEVARPWWMAVWTATGLGLLGLRQAVVGLIPSKQKYLLENEDGEPDAFQQHLENWLSPLVVILPVVFLTFACVNLAYLGWPQRLAGLLALTGLAVAHRLSLSPRVLAIFWPLVNWQLLAVFVTNCIETNGLVSELTAAQLATCGLPLAAFMAISACCFESRRLQDGTLQTTVTKLHQALLSLATLSLLAGAVAWYGHSNWTASNIAWAALAWVSMIGMFLTKAVREQSQDLAWWGEAMTAVAFGYFLLIGVCEPTNPVLAYLCLGMGLAQWRLGAVCEKSPRFAVLSHPLRLTGFWLPMLLVPFSIWRHVAEPTQLWAGANSLPLLGAAALYFWHGMERREVTTTMLSAAILNLAAGLLWRELHWTDPQLFLMPIGISVLAVTELLHREIPQKYHNPLRLIGSLVILVSPTFHIVTGSWAHIVTLMMASIAVSLVAIGLRIRTLLYTGTAFLLADLMATVVRGSVDQPNLLWIVGVAIGASVIALGAVCENHRETVLARLRGLASDLSQWR